MELTVSSFFSHYIFHPLQAPSKKERFLASIATLALAIISFGAVHCLCVLRSWIFKHKNPTQLNPSEIKANDAFKMTLNHSCNTQIPKFSGLAKGQKVTLPKVNQLLPNVFMGAYPADKDNQNHHHEMQRLLVNELGITHFFCLQKN